MQASSRTASRLKQRGRWLGAYGHVHDPVTYEKLNGWMGRAANYKIIVEEPFGRAKNKRLIALYDADTTRKFGPGTGKDRIIR